MKSKAAKGPKPSPVPPRIAKRPSPDDWANDELMTLPEAAKLFWPEPDGPLTTTSLRTAVRDRQLEVAIIAGKFLTTKAAVLKMSNCKLLDADMEDVPELEQRGRTPRSVAELRQRIAGTRGVVQRS